MESGSSCRFESSEWEGVRACSGIRQRLEWFLVLAKGQGRMCHPQRSENFCLHEGCEGHARHACNDVLQYLKGKVRVMKGASRRERRKAELSQKILLSQRFLAGISPIEAHEMGNSGCHV